MGGHHRHKGTKKKATKQKWKYMNLRHKRGEGGKKE